MFITKHDDGSVSYTGSFNWATWNEFLADNGLEPSDPSAGVPTGISADGEAILPADQPEAAGSEGEGATLSEQIAALDGEGNPAPTEPPAGNASLEEWQEYARAQGATEDDLADQGRNDLRDKYGSEEG